VLKFSKGWAPHLAWDVLRLILLMLGLPVALISWGRGVPGAAADFFRKGKVICQLNPLRRQQTGLNHPKLQMRACLDSSQASSGRARDLSGTIDNN